MSADVIIGDFQTTLDLPTERIFASAMGEDLEGVVIAGFDRNGKLHFWSTYGDMAQTNFALDLAKKRLLEHADTE